MKAALAGACCLRAGSFAEERGQGRQNDRSGRRGRRSLLARRTPAL